MKHSRKIAGIDTGKQKLDIALAGSSASLQVDNEVSGHRRLADWLSQQRVTRVGIEASGGYERTVVRYLRQQGITVVVFQPIQVRAFATFHLQRAKNDRIDAALIAQCAAATTKMRPAPDPRLQPLAEQLTLIEQIEEDIARCKTRREAFLEPRHRMLLSEQIKQLKAWRAAELRQIGAALSQHSDLANRLSLLESIPGIGRRTALALLIQMPELGTLSREQAATLLGVAPFDDDSGNRQGQRHIAGGRKRPRRALYAAALPAAFRWNDNLIHLYKRLTASGKSHKLALIACVRKLIIYANTVLARGTPWLERTPG